MSVVIGYELFIWYNPTAYMAKHAIVLIVPVECVSLFWYLRMVLTPDIQNAAKLVFMEFLCFWSAVGVIIVTEQLTVRYEARAGALKLDRGGHS